MTACSIGVAIAKATFTAAVWMGGTGTPLGTFPNAPEGMATFADAWSQHHRGEPPRSVLLVLEPTGGYELARAGVALEQGWQVSMPNPKPGRDWAKR